MILERLSHWADRIPQRPFVVTVEKLKLCGVVALSLMSAPRTIGFPVIANGPAFAANTIPPNDVFAP